MKRRDFLQAAAVAALPLSHVPCFADGESKKPRVMTVTGEVATDQLGMMLPHEHVLVDFIGADKVRPDRYDADEAFKVMLPYVNQVKETGCRAIADCTPAYLGRDPKLLKRLSKATGVKLLTNCGYYGARQGKFLPRHAHRESADELAKRWTAEWKNGIEDTGIRPGFIKIGVDAGELTAVNSKLVEAGARCHLVTGLTIAGHTGDGKAALQQIEILKKAGVSPSAWIWVHAQNERNSEIHLQVARAGAWVEFDGVGPASIDRHVELVQMMRGAGLLNRVLLSHDAGWYSVGEPRGGKVRGFDVLFTKFLPALRKLGFSDDHIKQLTVINPSKSFSIGVRSA
jgi:predicted metal-dependent phosphotriesterase family hydrolase